ncbi:MAG: hypothetical protein H6622_03680 [Halobacteriovoraceae bacterium]|nr:hypothetical protein [Halobacteriovoraceae bacterium]
MFRNLLALLCIILLNSCQKEIKAPDDVLKEFIRYRFKPGQIANKQDFQRYLDGEMMAIVESLDESQFKKFTELEGMKLKELDINNQTCEEKRCFITYTVSYEQSNNGKASYLVDTKKIAKLVLNNEKEWKIVSVTNIKSYLDNQQPLPQ